MKVLPVASISLFLVLLQMAPSYVEARLRLSPADKRAAFTDTTQELPRVHVRKLQGDLVGLGGRPPADEYPLQLCEGDCDLDEDVS